MRHRSRCSVRRCCCRAVGARVRASTQLRAFLDGAPAAASAAFTQTVTQPARSAAPRHRPARFAFARPGKFRWTYDKPFEQLIVGDGEKLWIYDRDLNQVIVRKLDRALGVEPRGDPRRRQRAGAELRRSPTAAAATGSSSSTRVRGRRTSGFERVRIGSHGQPAAADGVRRQLRQPDDAGASPSFERNVALDAAQFRFTPPPGADVVGE